jgi:hypothetical protein
VLRTDGSMPSAQNTQSALARGPGFGPSQRINESALVSGRFAPHVNPKPSSEDLMMAKYGAAAEAEN